MHREKYGVKEIYIDDLQEEFVRDFVYPMFRANTVYEGEYLLGTSIARPLIAKRLVEIAAKPVQMPCPTVPPVRVTTRCALNLIICIEPRHPDYCSMARVD